MLKALEIPSDIDLSELVRYLLDRGIRHWVTEEGLNQVVWVASEAEALFVQEAYSRFESGQLAVRGGVDFGLNREGTVVRVLRAAKRFPLTLLLIIINILLFPVGMNIDVDDFEGLFASMMFVRVEQIGGELYLSSFQETYVTGEWWRLVTPMFIHFSWLHIVFNLLWVWEIGRRIELINGASAFLTVVIVSSIAANVTQYVMSGPALFGGMSGVVFGLLGHSLIWSRLVPDRKMGVPNPIYYFMLGYLVVGFTGFIDLLGLGDIANGAHLGGLIGGLITGGLAVLIASRSTNHQP